MTLLDAIAAIDAGGKFGDVFPEVAPADHEALRAYFVLGVRPCSPPADCAGGPLRSAPNRPVRKAVAQARDAGYSGDECPTCGAMKMRRNGNCLCCDACGSTSGCS